MDSPSELCVLLASFDGNIVLWLVGSVIRVLAIGAGGTVCRIPSYPEGADELRSFTCGDRASLLSHE